METWRCGHPKTPENTYASARVSPHCRECHLARKRKYSKQRLGTYRREPKPVKVTNPYRADYEYGLAIAMKRRAERQKQVRAGMDAIRARYDALPERDKKMMAFMLLNTRN